METVLKVIWSVSAVSLMLLILLHSPKGDGLGNFGGQGQMFASTRSAETALNRVTWSLTLVFLLSTVLLSGPWLRSLPAPASTTPPVVETPAPAVPDTLPAPPQ
ncbi:MAG: preprotein translocase subunit SecG [Pseudanabaenaceae cyanobacterium]